MGSGRQLVINEKNCIRICRFLVGFVASKVFFGSFDFFFGIAYIFYPFMALFMLITLIATGKKELINDGILFLGVLGILYIAIPLVVYAIFDRMRKRCNDGDNLSIKRPHERLKAELARMYQELALLPGATLEDTGEVIKSGVAGHMYYYFSTEFSLQEVTDYYDKELKNKGWAFKNFEISRDLSGNPTGVKEIRYTRGNYLVYIMYNENRQERNKTKFSITFAFP